jgi:hypothetical protein
MVSRAADTSSETARPPSRREMLYYLGGASLGLLAAGSCTASLWMAMPEAPPHRFRVETFLPSVDMRPRYFSEGKCHLVRSDERLTAFDAFCPYDRGWLYWEGTYFLCVECYSWFYTDGRWMRGKAPRDMDRFVLEVVTSDHELRTSEIGDFVSIADASMITVDTSRVIQGEAHA